MSPTELKQMILADNQASAFAAQADWIECASRSGNIAPKLIRETRRTELSVLRILGPAAGEAVMQQIEAVALQNPVVKRVLKWLGPGSDGLDFGDSHVRLLLTLPAEQGGCGLTPEQAGPLLAEAEYPQTFTPAECRDAWSLS